MHRREVKNHEGKNCSAKKKLEGRYANYFKVGYNAFEFVLDFGQYYAESEEAELYTRIITSPNYAKDLLRILQDSISGHQKAFGALKKNCIE